MRNAHAAVLALFLIAVAPLSAQAQTKQETIQFILEKLEWAYTLDPSDKRNDLTEDQITYHTVGDPNVFLQAAKPGDPDPLGAKDCWLKFRSSGLHRTFKHYTVAVNFKELDMTKFSHKYDQIMQQCPPRNLVEHWQCPAVGGFVYGWGSHRVDFSCKSGKKCISINAEDGKSSTVSANYLAYAAGLSRGDLETVGNQLAKAMAHMVDLCGGKEPF